MMEPCFTTIGFDTSAIPAAERVLGSQLSIFARLLQANWAIASKDKALAPFMPPPDMFPHTHCGIDDAEEQLELFLNLLK